MTGDLSVDEVFQDQPHRRVVRIGDTVRRPVQPWTPAVHALLDHLAAVGFPYAPRVLGIDEQGREVLSHIPGEAGPAGWAPVVDDAGLTAFARLLREYHDAVAGFVPPPGAVWVTGPGAPGDGEVVCHGDFGPWNVVWRDGRPVGLIDWDYARPAPPLHDVAYALEYTAPFRDDAEAVRWLRYPAPPDRRGRLERFRAAYGLASADGLVDAVIEVQRGTADLCRRLAAAGREPQATWAAEGYLRELDDRVAWSTAHRYLFA
ncbi:aminoglycoside phosphotransferase family protein [Streptomyces litchfieldiae]|uniref:Aminoglycoside phosphotransferase family protein n=1 Tax=Streptomyces litchfieldiae TaxID=3075543 RepID=A0ABU2MNU6_9ACTN|nr:aminoglycoside phosphotransferase family protein [Streptomyces sp. DSM 44938]MDT0343292.1 aminoglycoside phosphotransferase family protein [Streptomyces sp. DSM 44938]